MVKAQKIKSPRCVVRSRAAIRHSKLKGVFTQQYRAMVKRALQNPTTNEGIRQMYMQQIKEYARMGGKVSDMLS